MQDVILDVSQAVALLNQTLEYAYPSVRIVGELAEFRVSKGKWVYFDLKDEGAKLRCFGSVWQVNPSALEDGMTIEVVAQPRIHPQFGFNLNVAAARPVGEGSIKKAADLLHAKLEKEGLFAPERKRLLPYPPQKIGLIASGESAGYADFVKILQSRWPLLSIEHYNVQVQGAQAEEDVVRALQMANQHADLEVLIVIRGGGSADDLATFSTESVTRAVAASRIPTMVAIGHEVDTSLAELAADVRASTPSNAAELLVPDKQTVQGQLVQQQKQLQTAAIHSLQDMQRDLKEISVALDQSTSQWLEQQGNELRHARTRIDSYHPKHVLKRGYGLIRHKGTLVKDAAGLQTGDEIAIELLHDTIDTNIQRITPNKKGTPTT